MKIKSVKKKKKILILNFMSELSTTFIGLASVLFVLWTALSFFSFRSSLGPAFSFKAYLKSLSKCSGSEENGGGSRDSWEQVTKFTET